MSELVYRTASQINDAMIRVYNNMFWKLFYFIIYFNFLIFNNIELIIKNEHP